MAGGYQVGISSETRAFKQGIDSGIIEPLEDAQKELVELGKSRGPEQLEQSMKDAQDATKKLEKETKETAAAIEREYRDASRKAKTSLDDVGDGGALSMGKVRDGAQEVQQELGQNLGEAVSSIRGDLSDLGQVGQDTLGGLAGTVAGMGPVGLAGAFALAAGAAGLGAVTAGIEDAKERQEELNQAAADWASAYTDSAGKIVSASHIVAEIQAIITDPDRYEQAGKNAADWGVDVSTALGAMAGDSTALAIAQQALADRAAEAEAALAKQEEQVDGNAEAAYKLSDSVNAGQESMSALTGAMTAGAEQARIGAEALYNYAQQTGVATGETDDLGNKILSLPDGKEIVIDAQTQTAYEDLDAIERKQLSNKTVRVNVDTSAWDLWVPGQKTANIKTVFDTNGRLVP